MRVVNKIVYLARNRRAAEGKEILDGLVLLVSEIARTLN